MSFSACCVRSQFSLKADRSWQAMQPHPNLEKQHGYVSAFGGTSAQAFGLRVARLGTLSRIERSFLGGPKIVLSTKVAKLVSNRKEFGVSASLFTSAHIASNVFTLGTAAVLPFYTLMVLAPKAQLTKRSMESGIPYVVLGFLYGYLLCLSWTPDTLRLMFASKYMLPELSGMLKMFSNEMTLASAWIHLLAVDLFAARQVYHDGLENNIETRHSVSLCLLFCPIGILAHVVTKLWIKGVRNTEQKL